jgi:hypothetical protein
MKMLLSAATNAGTSADSDARTRLLRRSLHAYCTSSRQQLISGTEVLAEGKTPMTMLESLSAFAAPKHATLVLFDGLVNAPQAHVGRNVLVCMGSLQAELQNFAQRNAVDTKTNPLWWKNILRNYERIVLLDNHAFAQSAGFAPWAKLYLADDFPVELAPKRDAGRILILNHDPDATEAVLGLHDTLAQLAEVSVIGPNSVISDDLDYSLEACVHVHYGYGSHRAATALTPIDSLVNGFYTIVMAPPADDMQRSEASALQEPDLPSAVLREIRRRSYGLVVEDTSELLEAATRFLTRLAMFARDKMAINPELQGYASMNEEYISARHSYFTAQVPA